MRRAIRKITTVAVAAILAGAVACSPHASAPLSGVDVAPIVVPLPDGGVRVECPPYGLLVSVDGTDTIESLTCRAA